MNIEEDIRNAEREKNKVINRLNLQKTNTYWAKRESKAYTKGQEAERLRTKRVLDDMLATLRNDIEVAQEVDNYTLITIKKIQIQILEDLEKRLEKGDKE